MDVKVKKPIQLTRICTLILFILQRVICDDARNLQNHRNAALNLKDVASHWIGMPKSPYLSYTVTANPTTASTTRPTSAPLSVNKVTKHKRTKSKKASNKRRYDDDDDDENDYSTDYRTTYRNKNKFAYEEDFDYDYNEYDSKYPSSYLQSPYFARASKSVPKAMYVNPIISSGSQTVKAIYAGTPKVATYVVPDTQKYVVERVKSDAVYVPPISPDLYAAASSSGMRRLDPIDYDDTGSSFLNLGPQQGFPPKPVMNKIAQPGQRQPCHGPDCHQHHKGLVRFYWRRVVYPPNEDGRVRGGRVRFRRPRGRNRRRRLRGSARAPSDQKDIYYTEEDDAEETGENTNTFDNENNNDEEEEEEDNDNEENDSNRRNVWKPGKAYGHDLSEGNNYDAAEQKVYRDKRYAYRKHMRNRYLKNLKGA